MTDEEKKLAIRRAKLARDNYGKPFVNLCPARQTAIDSLIEREDNEHRNNK